MHPDTQRLEMLKRCVDQHTDSAKVCGAMFSCDLFAFTLYGGMPAVVFGPAGEKLHGPDEWVSISSMEKVTLSLRDFLVDWCGANRLSELCLRSLNEVVMRVGVRCIRPGIVPI
jgi:hypothetical protein